MEILKEKNLVPKFKKKVMDIIFSLSLNNKGKVDDFVFVVDEILRPEANGMAYKLRKKGRIVELSLESKKIKWAFKVLNDILKYIILNVKMKRIEKLDAERMILVGLQEWEKGYVRIKNLKTKEEKDIPVSDL